MGERKTQGDFFVYFVTVWPEKLEEWTGHFLRWRRLEYKLKYGPYEKKKI